MDGQDCLMVKIPSASPSSSLPCPSTNLDNISAYLHTCMLCSMNDHDCMMVHIKSVCWRLHPRCGVTCSTIDRSMSSCHIRSQGGCDGMTWLISSATCSSVCGVQSPTGSLYQMLGGCWGTLPSAPARGVLSPVGVCTGADCLQGPRRSGVSISSI